ncbi:MAG TPA: AAA family ATPase, partial [Polyangiaceae bacterium]
MPPPAVSDSTELARQLAGAGYLASDELALVAWLALALERPLLVEGPAGVGKTDLARALSEAMSRELVRLQCYEGLDEARALYEWDYAKQMLYTQLLRESVSAQTAGAATLTEAADRV